MKTSTPESCHRRCAPPVWSACGDHDVLDERVMPAVDSPGTPDFDYAQLASIVDALCATGRVAGVTFAIYDPDRDPGMRHAKPLVRCIADAVRSA